MRRHQVPTDGLQNAGAVGTATSFRSISLNGNGTIANATEDTNTVTAVDNATKSVTRVRSSDNRAETIGYDKPRDGLRYRALNSCTIGGALANCAETVQLPLQGMGINIATSVGSNPAAAFFNLTVNKP